MDVVGTDKDGRSGMFRARESVSKEIKVTWSGVSQAWEVEVWTDMFWERVLAREGVAREEVIRLI